MLDDFWLMDDFADIFDMYVRGEYSDGLFSLEKISVSDLGIGFRSQYLFLKGLLLYGLTRDELMLEVGDQLISLCSSKGLGDDEDSFWCLFSRLIGLLFKMFSLSSLSRFDDIEALSSEFLFYKSKLLKFKRFGFLSAVFSVYYNLVMAYYHREILKFDNSFRYVEAGLDLVLRLRDGVLKKFLHANLLTFISSLYYWRGDLKNSFRYSLEGVLLWESLGNEAMIATAYLNLARVYNFRGKRDISFRYALQALSFSKNRPLRVRDHAALYSVLVELYLFSGDRERAMYYLKEFQDFCRGLSHVSPDVNQLLDLSFAMVWLRSNRLKDIDRALSILRDIVGSKTHFSVYSKALLLIIPGLFFELAVFENPDVAKEIRSLIDELFYLGKRFNSSLFFVFAYWYLGKYQLLVELDFEGARRFLGSALRTAEVNELWLLAGRISNDLEYLLNNREFWLELLEKEDQWRYNFFLLNRNGFSLSVKEDLMSHDEGDDVPVALLIFDSNYDLLYSTHFSQDFDIDFSLLGLLLQSLKNLGEEVFDSASMFELVKLEHWTVLVSSVGDFNICYVYSGGSMLKARQRLKDFIVEFFKLLPVSDGEIFDVKLFLSEIREDVERIIKDIFSEKIFNA